MKTTLNKIKEHSPWERIWTKLLSSLNKTEADDEELSLLTILESNGLNDALWALKAVDGFDREIRLMACDFAESVVHLAKDERCVHAIKVARNYANGLATKEELNAAATGAYWASWEARMTAADNDAASVIAAHAAEHAAYRTAAEAADWAATSATGAAASAAASRTAAKADWTAAGAAEREKQIAIFKKYVK